MVEYCSPGKGQRQGCIVPGRRGARGEPDYVGAILTFGDLIGWHSQVHAIVNEVLFRRDGFFVRITRV